MKESQGLLADETLDNVGYGLLFRCESILAYTEALSGRVECKRSAKSGKTTITERETKKTTEMI